MMLARLLEKWVHRNWPHVSVYRPSEVGIEVAYNSWWIFSAGLPDGRDLDKIHVNSFKSIKLCGCCADSYAISPADPSLFQKLEEAINARTKKIESH